MTLTASRRLDFDEVFASIAEGASEREKRELDPRDQIAALKDAGLTAITLDFEHGGDDASIVELIKFIIDLARADPIVAHILRAHFWFVEQVRRLPEGEIRDRWSSEIAAGKIFGNASSERNGSAGALRFQTRLKRSRAGWELSGEKFYSTGTAFSDYVAAQAFIDDGSERVARVLVPADRDGVRILDDWDGIGQHRTGTGTTEFHQVHVDGDEVLTIFDPSDGVRGPNDAPLLQLFLQALITGILESVVDDATSILRSRSRTFAHAPSEQPRHDPILLNTVGNLDAAAFSSRATVVEAAQTIDRAVQLARNGQIEPALFDAASVAAARAKVHVDQIGLSAAGAVFDVGGASSASRARNFDRHWRNIRTITLHNPTAYKAVALGDLQVNGEAFPDNGYF